MKRKLFAIFALVLVFVTALMVFAACGEKDPGSGPEPGSDGTTPGEKTVTAIEVTPPVKTDYTVGETFSIEGGSVKVTYSDGSSETLALDAEGVTMNTPNMNNVGKKTITVRYGGKRDSFDILVAQAQYTVTLNLGYDDKTESVGVTQNDVLEAEDIEDPERSGYTFQGWFSEPTLTVAYEFIDEVTAPMTLYARWLKDGDSVDFNFDFNRTGIFTPVVELKYEKGATSVEYAGTPSRVGYDFEGWYIGAKDQEGNVSFGSEYTFGTTINEDTTVYAKWKKNFTGSRTFTFQAENIDLSGKTGPGYSSTSSEWGMVVSGSDVGAEGGQYLSYVFYQNGNYVDFEIDAAEDVENVTLVARLSIEGSKGYTFNPSNFKVYVINGTDDSNKKEVQYSDITLTPPPVPEGGLSATAEFKDFTLGNISLTKGSNKIRFQTNNTDSPGGAMKAQGPLLDCIRLTSTEAIDWDCSAKRFPMGD